ncbi:MAG: nickel pincer cofactor biosynthesis protein LarC [Suilimivivens sp.]
MGQTLYLECNSGISGDMAVAALLDLGVNHEVLMKALKSLPVQGFEIEISRVKKAGLDVCDFNVKLDEIHENHDHDMEYLHGHTHHHEDHHHEEHHHEEHQHEEAHQHEAEHHHEEVHQHEAGHHHHEHRGLSEVFEIIEKAGISDRAKATATHIFQVLAEAEAKAHGIPSGQVHFHEVGAVDSIVDIVAVAVCLDELDITEVIVPCVCEGRGTVRCQHGILPIPVPAVVNIMEKYKLPVRMTEIEGELVTPTGAAIVAAIQTSSVLPKQFTVRKIGVGAGKRNYERPSLLRAMLIESEKTEKSYTGEESDIIYKLETNIDDCSGELLGYVMDKLMNAGARDVHYIPVFMKKNRPAYELVVICDENKIEELEQIIFQETTTIGIRRIAMERTILKRETISVKLAFGELDVKKCTMPDGQTKYYPEYESAARLAKQSGRPLGQILDELKRSI